MNKADQNAETVSRGSAAINSANMETLTEPFTRPSPGTHRGKHHLWRP